MPPASSPQFDPTHSVGLDVNQRAARVRFRRAIALVVMTLVLPGSAQLVAGNRRIGRIALRIWFGLLLVALSLVLLSTLWHSVAFFAVSDGLILSLVRLVLIALAVGWAVLFIDAWRLGQPLTLAQGHRLAMVGMNGTLCFSVAGALLFGAHVVGVQQQFLNAMFSATDTVGAHEGRYNMLLLGGDSGAGRWGLRPDSLTIASIDGETGKTVLIGLPRNMANFPFAKGSVMREQFPDGFNCEGCYLNGVSTWAGDHPELFGKSAHPGTDATVMAVEGITGLKINYWAMVNLEGFKELVDAVGGVELTVRQPIPVGGLGDDVVGYIQPGTRKLNGHDTLWFARAREGSDDYSRMARQKCVMNAMLQQISPQTALANFERIAQASSSMISTSVPRGEVSRFIALALKAKSQNIATVSLVPPRINTADPDIAEIHDIVQTAIDRSEGDAAAPAKPKGKGKTAPVTTGGSVGSLRDGYAANEADNLDSVC